jgi:8-oxo-dGTP pyrophosphatase MutT (NUDIX family)
MIKDTTHFQYCQKTVIFSEDFSSILLAKRKGEADFDGDYSFVCGKMETTDESIVAGIRREVREELGSDVHITIYPTYTVNVHYTKKDGNSMILPHIFSVYHGGMIQLSDEYSEYMWVPIGDIDTLEPKVHTIPDMVKKLFAAKDVILASEGVEI